MNKKWLVILIVIAGINCEATSSSWKELDLGVFKISIPKTWIYKKEDGEDSFVGEIVTPNSKLSFDYSSNGYASSLLPTEQEYLKKRDWMNACYFCKAGVTYTADFNVKSEKARQMKALGTADSSLVHVEADPSYQTKVVVNPPSSDQKSKFPNADYVATLTYKDSTIIDPIELPAELKNHHIKIDTTPSYIIKTIWPKVSSKGMTGLYIKSRSSHLNFQISALNLSDSEENLVLRAFKTITLKYK